MDRGRKSRAGASRLSEMPMRVADTNRTSMYATPMTTPQSKFGKLNIPKPPSVTSERRTSFFGPRASGSRHSTLGGFGGAEKIKDTRPLHDKGFVQQCIRQLREFLTENGFQVTSKMLQSPSTKEFFKMFEFIYSQLDETYQMPTSKVEEEVPRILKDLGYPFAISKSSMYSVGAPHTWPQVLGAVVWLIDTVTTFRCMSKEQLLFTNFDLEENLDIEDGVEYNKLVLDHTAETYRMYMEGADSFEAEEEAFLSKLKKLYNVDEEKLASLEEQHRLLTAQAEQLEKDSQKDPLMAKRMQKLTLQTDLNKLQSYHGDQMNHLATLESKASELNEDVEAAAHRKESLEQEQKRLQQLLQKQKFTPADVERINREKSELQQTLTRLSKDLEESEKLVWNEEMTLARVKEKSEYKLVEYHKLARQLKLIPVSAENAGGYDFEIMATSEFRPATMGLHKTQMQKLIGNVEEEARRLTTVKFSLEESIEQVNCNFLDKSNDLKQLTEQIRRLDEQMEHDMQDLAREEEKYQAEVESVENHQKLLEEKVNQGYDEAVQQMKAAHQQYHLVVQETNEERRTVFNNLTCILGNAASHLGIIEKMLEDMHSKVHRICSKATEEDEAALLKLRDVLRTFVSKANRM